MKECGRILRDEFLSYKTESFPSLTSRSEKPFYGNGKSRDPIALESILTLTTELCSVIMRIKSFAIHSPGQDVGKYFEEVRMMSRRIRDSGGFINYLV